MKRVVYLFGAGASHACVKAVGGPLGILTKDLSQDLADEVKRLLGADLEGIETLVNDVVDEETDIEHVITFLDESVSEVHRRLASQLRSAFEEVLRSRLEAIASDNDGVPPVGLYEALLDMHNVEGIEEEISGVLTLNYDHFIETALARQGISPDFGIRVSSTEGSKDRTLPLVKLHGSFEWAQSWPVLRRTGRFHPLWIPPGVQKAKGQYPFNMLWGRARELLDCDILRVVGCRLGANDWDLVSLLFTTRYGHSSRHPYRVEVIDNPALARSIQGNYPYLDVQSILQVQDVGDRLLSEWVGVGRTYESLTAEELSVVSRRNENWFRTWLQQRAEALYVTLGTVDTPHGAFKSMLGEV